MKHLKIVLISMSAAVLSGCVTSQPSAQPQTTQISCTIPKIDVIADKVNQQTQTKGGLDITIVPALYQAVHVDRTTVTQVQPNLGEMLIMHPQVQVVAEQSVIPELRAEPDRIVFTVKIHNQLNRVFHGQGAVVQFNVDGTLIPFNNTDYKEFSGGIVPPLNDEDFKIYGPPLDTLKDKGTITIYLYDVVTATDAAGNTTQKQNYTWDFSYTMQTVTDSGEVKKSRSIMSMDQYQQMQMSQSSQENSGATQQ